MALSLPSGKVKFYTGLLNNFNNIGNKDINGLYVINDNDKLYLYNAGNPIYAPIDVATSVNSTSTKPVTSKAVYEFFNDDINVDIVYAGVDVLPDDDRYSPANMIAGKFYYFDNGTLKFQYGMGKTPLTLKDSFAEIEINGVSLLANKHKNKIIFKTDDNLLLTPNDTEGSITIGLNNSAGGFIVSNPLSDSQTINKDLKLTGDVYVASGKKIVVDTIEKANTTSSSVLTLNNNTAVQGDLRVLNAIDVQNLTASNNITAGNLIQSKDLIATGAIDNSGIFITSQKNGTINPKFTLNSITEFYFGSGYYLKSSGISLPGGTISGNLILGNSSSSHLINSNTTTFTGTIYLNNNNSVSNTTFNNIPLVVGANSATTPHLEVALDGLQAKSSNLANTTLSLNPYGGQVNIGSGGLSVSGNASISNQIIIGDKIINTNVFSSSQPVTSGDTVAPNITLENTTEFFFGASKKYYLKPNSAKLPALRSDSLNALDLKEGTVPRARLSGNEFIGCTATTAGTYGIVPTPAAGKQEAVLLGDGNWNDTYEFQINDTLTSTIDDTNKTITLGVGANYTNTVMEMIVIGAGTAEGNPPATVTPNTKIWIDTSIGNGVPKILVNSVWTPVSSVWT